MGDHGPAAVRKIPPKADEIHDAPLPEECPDRGVPLEEERVAHQYQTEVPEVRPLSRSCWG